MKRIRKVIFAALVLMAINNVGFAAETFVLGYTNLRGQKAPVPLGVDEGIFARHGIVLKLVSVSPGTLGVPKLLAGEIDLFLGNSEPVVRAVGAEGKRLVVIANLGADGVSIFSRPAISKVEELRGKKIGSSVDGASVDRNTKKALRKLGLDPSKDVTIVYTSFQNSFDRLRVLAAGEVDATVAGADALPELGADAAKVRKLIDLLDIGIAISGADISVSRDLLDRKRDALKNFARALQESFRLARSRPDLVRRTYEKHLQLSNPLTLDKMVEEYMEAKATGRPAPDPRVIEAYIEELLPKYPNAPKDAKLYMDATLF